jgi:hypothetical protein
MEIFNEALEQPSPAARDAYLKKVCQGDSGLRKQVETLLAAYENADGFIPTKEESVMRILHEAMIEYANANGGKSPTDVAQLKPYLETPLEDPVLARYEMVAAEDVTYSEKSQGGEQRFLAEKAPVDFDLDHRYVIGTSGYGATDFETDLLVPVVREWQAATNGEGPEDPALLWPYVTSEAQERALLRRTERFHNPALIVPGIEDWGHDLDTGLI